MMTPLTLLLIGYASVSLAAAPTNQKEIARQRQEIVDGIQTSYRPESVADQRWLCISGDEPAHVRESRAQGFEFTPDASDSCLAALKRKANDHQLLEPYKKLVANIEGNPAVHERLPQAVGAAVLSGNGKVSIGNGKGINVDAALALDAGFTIAYMTSAAKKADLDREKVKLVIESCLDQKNDAATCFSIGYALGAQAVNAQ